MKLTHIITFITVCFTLLSSCGDQEQQVALEVHEETEAEVITDEHSYSNIAEVKTTHLHLDINVNFEEQVIEGSAKHEIENIAGADKVIFDVFDMNIQRVLLDGEKEATFNVGEKDELHGSPLEVKITAETKSVTIFYKTSPNAEALQWLNPQQTAGKEHPYLFTQGQAILTRSWIPCQDSPGNRITYSADVKVPAELMAVMSATNPTEPNEDGEYYFEMNNPIPSYLIALAVGDLDFAPLGDRTGVYAEPSMIEKCIAEFEDVESMVDAAESLYGEYRWGRYDIIVLPPSFPFGGMENPKLTFATPTIIAGDKSLVTLIAHELAHSWSGNLVTNATWDDFWLNEGFTVYFEYRIMEEVYDKEYVDMLMQIEYDNLLFTNEMMLNGDHPEDTKLKLDLNERNPDDGMTDIAYVKGAFFLKTLEEEVGRDKFDSFLNKYFEDHKFQTITTEQFVVYLDKELLEPNKLEFNVDEWIYEEGIPTNCVAVHSDRFEKAEAKAQMVTAIDNASQLELKRSDYSTHEWLHFIRSIPAAANAEDLAMLDEQFGFSDWGNSEVMAEWYVLSINKGYEGINPHLENFLVSVGRRKFLEPIYTELSKTDEGLTQANEIYAKARPNYHAVSYNTIDDILGWEG